MCTFEGMYNLKIETNMKKILTIAFALFCMTAVAQNRPTFIVQGGYQGSNFTDVKNSKLGHGFRIGAAIDYAFVTSDTYDLSVQLGANYSMKGAGKSYFTIGSKSAETKTTLQYVDVPILLNSRFKLSDSFNAFVNFGPYLAYGLSAKESHSENIFGIELKPNSNLFKTGRGGSGDPIFKSFDYGVQVGAGVEMNKVMIGVGTQYGLTSIYKNDKDGKNKNISFYASVGYRF